MLFLVFFKLTLISQQKSSSKLFLKNSLLKCKLIFIIKLNDKSLRE
jgi:hypothetical protein